MKETTSVKGIIMALTAAMLWGVSGTCAQYVFEVKHLNAAWLVTMRLLVAGIVLLAFAGFKQDKDLIAIWKNKYDAIMYIRPYVFTNT